MSVDIVSRVEQNSVTVDISNGERLRYRMLSRGAVPRFTLEDAGVERTLLNQDSPPISEEPLVHERTWPRQGDQILTISDHTMGMSFLAAVEYTYQAVLLAADGSVKDVLIDMDFIASSSEDDHFQNLTVNLE